MLSEIMNAMKEGQQLKDPTTWKHRQNTTNAVAGVLAGILVLLRFFNVELPVSEDILQSIAELVAVILGLVNLILTTITTKKVGL